VAGGWWRLAAAGVDPVPIAEQREVSCDLHCVLKGKKEGREEFIHTYTYLGPSGLHNTIKGKAAIKYVSVSGAKC